MKPSIWRTSDLAREHSLSAQAVRNYEELGALPPAERTAGGYRRYTDLHVEALRTFLALRAGYGHRPALDLMRRANLDDMTALYRRLDELHVGFSNERRTHTEVTAAFDALDATPSPKKVSEKLTIGELAHRLDIHPATLRQWEAGGIIDPARDRTTGYRTYDSIDIRDAHLTRYLRKAGISLEQVAGFVHELHRSGNSDRLRTVLDEWEVRLDKRSRRAIHGVALLDSYLMLHRHQFGLPCFD